MPFEEITDTEIENLVQNISWCVRKQLRNFAAEKKEKRLLALLNGAKLSEGARLRAYLEETDYDPTLTAAGLTIYHRPYTYLAEYLRLTPANGKKLLKQLAAEHLITTSEVDGRLIVMFPQAKPAKPK